MSPSCSKTKSVKVPPVSTPIRIGLPTNVHPAAALVRLAQSVEHDLNAIAILETGRVFDRLPAAAQRLDDTARKRGEATRPTTLAHALSHVVLIDLHRTPLPRTSRRTPQLAGLFNHQRALGAVDLEPVFILP